MSSNESDQRAKDFAVWAAGLSEDELGDYLSLVLEGATADDVGRYFSLVHPGSLDRSQLSEAARARLSRAGDERSGGS